MGDQQVIFERYQLINKMKCMAPFTDVAFLDNSENRNLKS